MKNKYVQIKDLAPGKDFDFFTNFSDQVLVNKTIKINDVGKDYFDCLTDDEQNYVQQMPKYANLDYDQVIEQYDKDVLPTVIKKERANGWLVDDEGNIIGVQNEK